MRAALLLNLAFLLPVSLVFAQTGKIKRHRYRRGFR